MVVAMALQPAFVELPAPMQTHSFIPKGAETRMYEMAAHMMKMLMSIMAALSLGSLLFLMAVL